MKQKLIIPEHIQLEIYDKWLVNIKRYSIWRTNEQKLNYIRNTWNDHYIRNSNDILTELIKENNRYIRENKLLRILTDHIYPTTPELNETTKLNESI